ncbi:MAG: hypothetical protein V4506_09715 [Bacteroidota bacterium]
MKHIVFLVALLTACLSTWAQEQKHKTPIDTAQINYVELVKYNGSKAASFPRKQLSKTQYADFAKVWNLSKKIGTDKYKMSYYVYVHLKNGKTRQFTIAANKIQEQDWMTFDITDKTYFDKLWEAAK